MGSGPGLRWWGTSALVLAAGSVLALLAAAGGLSVAEPSWSPLVDVAVAVLPVALGVLVSRRRPASPVGAALVLLGGAPAATRAVEIWGALAGEAIPGPGGTVAAAIASGFWMVNLAGFVVLCAVFPDGPLPGRRWAAVPWAYAAVAAAVVAVVAVAPDSYAARGGPLPGASPVAALVPWWNAAALSLAAALLTVLGAGVAAVALRARRGGPTTRQQIKWLALGAGTVPVLLAAGWVAETLGASVAVAYTGFALGITVLVPAAVAVAILRHDVLDIDRVLDSSVSWALTASVSAAAFAVVVLGVTRGAGPLTPGVVDGSGVPGAGLAAAAFVTALVLVPLHRILHEAVGRLLDRERVVAAAAVRAFTHGVRDGVRRPEDVEEVLRAAVGDPRLRVLLRVPGHEGYRDLDGLAVADTRETAPGRLVPLTAGDVEVGAVVLSVGSARRTRLARELAAAARLPLEVSRLHLGLRTALDDARSSRARLVEAGAQERRRLERDLHDGVQQRILAVGMRLRSLQRRHRPGDAVYEELEAAVDGLTATVAELRRLAHGVRPVGLDDGLGPAVRALAAASPIPVLVEVDDESVDRSADGSADVSGGRAEAVATTAYFVVSECLANTLKHSGAGAARVRVGRAASGVSVEVSDDGRGGAGAGFGMTSMRDRVVALGGTLVVDSVAGRGTTVRACFPDGA